MNYNPTPHVLQLEMIFIIVRSSRLELMGDNNV